MEKWKEFGLVHDAITHSVKELKAKFISVVGKDGTIFNVPFSFDRVPGSITGEALCEEFIQKNVLSKRIEGKWFRKTSRCSQNPSKRICPGNWIEEATFENESILDIT